MKKWKVRICGLLIVIMSFWSLMSDYTLLLSYAAEQEISVIDKGEETVYYVALGDSLTTGNGTSIPYVNKVSDYLTNQHGKCITKNLAVDGWKSGDLLNALTNPVNSKYKSYREMISQADVITLDIGTNDIYMTMLEVITDRLGCTIEEYGKTAQYWEERYMNTTGVARIVLYMQLYSIVTDITFKLKYGDVWQNAINDFEDNYREILTEIESLAPNAQVYVGNLFNPFIGVEPIQYESYVVIDIREMINKHVLKINEIIKEGSSGNCIVDLYSVMNNKSYIRGIVEYNYYYDPHLTQAGQEAIASRFIAALSANE